MKTFTSEDNLVHYFMRDREKMDISEVFKLNKKIKSIKNALKLAEKHNVELHDKIKNMKENHSLQLLQAETEVTKYKQLYEMVLENYELSSVELRDCRKRLKKMEMDNSPLYELQQYSYQQTILKQDKELAKLREENKLLYDQIFQKNTKIREYESISSRRHPTPIKNQQKDRTFLTNLKLAIENKNEEFDKISHDKSKLISIKAELEKEVTELTLKLAKTNAELDFQRRHDLEEKDKMVKLEKEVDKLNQEKKELTQKYCELLSFNYELQKQFEKQLQTMARQLDKKIHQV